MAKKKKKDPEEDEETWEEDEDQPQPPDNKMNIGKLVISIFIAVVLIISFVGCIILISIQEEDGPSNTDKEPPIIAFLEPEASSIFAPGEKFNITVDTGEDEDAVKSVTGKITDGEYKIDLVEFTMTYTEDFEWTVELEIPSGSSGGDWFIYIQAWDSSGNLGWVELPIQISGRAP